MDRDLEHLKLLSIFHYIVGGLTALFACFPIIHFTLGVVLIVAPGSMGGPPGSQPPRFVGWLMLLAGGGFMLYGWTSAVCMLLAGRCLARRTHHTFCLIVAGLSCLHLPYGTVLGVFTFVVLLRPSVRELFGVADRWAPPPAPADEHVRPG